MGRPPQLGEGCAVAGRGPGQDVGELLAEGIDGWLAIRGHASYRQVIGRGHLTAIVAAPVGSGHSERFGLSDSTPDGQRQVTVMVAGSLTSWKRPLDPPPAAALSESAP